MWDFCSWRVIHKEMTDIRTRLPSDLGALLCWSVKKWRWLWQSALNDAISLLMRWWLHSRPASGIRLGKWVFVFPPDRCAESRQSSKPVSVSRWLFLSSHYATSCLFNQILIRYIFGSQNTSRPTCHCGPAGVKMELKQPGAYNLYLYTRNPLGNCNPWCLVMRRTAKYLFFPARKEHKCSMSEYKGWHALQTEKGINTPFLRSCEKFFSSSFHCEVYKNA